MNPNSLFLYSILIILSDVKSNHQYPDRVSADEIAQVMELIEVATKAQNIEHLNSSELEAYLTSFKAASHKLVCTRFNQFPLPLLE